jgi:peptidoglycan hydrolase-like protein with peptidoglycan-binding domain
MEVITENPIIYIGANDTYDAEIFLALDGSNPSLVRDFQEWANDKYKLGLKVDGKAGTKTRSAYKKYGEIYEKDQRGVGLAKPKVEKPAPPTVIPAVNPTPTQIAEAKKKGFNWDKARGAFVKAQELGIIDALLGKLGITPRTTTELPEVGTETGMPLPDAEKKGMNTTTKVLIGVGLIAVIGVILYSLKSKSK